MKTPDIRAARNHSNQEATVGAMLPAQQAAVAHDTTKSIESPDVLVQKKKVSVRRNEDDQDQAQELAFDQTSAEVTDGTDAQPMLLAQASTETRTDVGAGATQQPVFASPSDEAVAAEMATAEGMIALEWAALALGGLGIGGVAAAAAGSGGGTSGVSAVAHLVTGIVTAGPLVSGHKLTLKLYAADGTLLKDNIPVDAYGRFTVDVGTYTGAVIAKVFDADDGNDYRDQATGSLKDINALLMAVGNVPPASSTITLNINPLTPLRLKLRKLVSKSESIFDWLFEAKGLDECINKNTTKSVIREVICVKER